MKVFSERVFSFLRKCRNELKGKKSDHVFYKIVDSSNDCHYKLQCINTKAGFYAGITDIVFDKHILYGLHPIQSCYIGIEYAQSMNLLNGNNKAIKRPMNEQAEDFASRYGLYSVCYQDRRGKVFFCNKLTGEGFTMDPRDIAFDINLIEEFDSAQAFYIGLLTGLKLMSPSLKSRGMKYPHLKLVK